MLPTNDNDIKRYIKRSAEAQAPDAWAGIERRIHDMTQSNIKQTTKKRSLGWAAAVAACAVLALAAVTLVARPGFLFGAPATTPAASAAATPDPQVRQPVPFTDNAALTKQGGRKTDIKFYESLKELAQSQWTKDIAEFEFVREAGKQPADGGRAMYTFYEMKVTKAFKGSLKPGDTVTVRTFGGASDSVWIEDDFVERFTADFGYVLFLDNFDDNGKTVYQLASPLQGYVPVRGGAVSLNTKIEANGLFAHGEKLADLEKRIGEAVK
jgi:hypothetical protein